MRLQIFENYGKIGHIAFFLLRFQYANELHDITHSSGIPKNQLNHVVQEGQ